jgi:hypothetical protein
MSRIGTWLPFFMPAMSMPTGRISRSRFKDLRVATEEIVRIDRARQARHRKYRQLVRWLMTRLGRRRPINVLERDLRRRLPASSAAVALSPCCCIVLCSIQLAFDDHRIHVIEHEGDGYQSLVALLANQRAQVVDFHPRRNCGPLHAVRLGRVQRLATCRLAPVRGRRFLSRCRCLWSRGRGRARP